MTPSPRIAILKGKVLGRALACAGVRRGLIAAACRSRRHQAHDFLLVARDGDLFALLARSGKWPSLFLASKAPISRTDHSIFEKQLAELHAFRTCSHGVSRRDRLDWHR
jgi:hypothetical protein